MHPRETGAHYDRVALWYQRNIPATYGVAQLERALRFAENKGAALDVGCGSNGRFLEVFLRGGFQPEGVDVSGEMIALARQRHPGVPFYHADICEWELPRRYDFLSAWDSTFHLPIEQQEPVLRKLCAGLNPGGVLLFTCGGGEAEEITGSFEGQTFGYSTLGVDEFLRLLMLFGCSCLHVEYDQYPENHVYIIARKRPRSVR
ncbi:MAG: class I SAM-dependent methyltransferase [Terrimicrobiaceae bacterium]